MTIKNIKKPDDSFLRMYNALLITICVFLGGLTSFFAGKTYLTIQSDHEMVVKHDLQIVASQKDIENIEYTIGINPKTKSNLPQKKQTSWQILR